MILKTADDKTGQLKQLEELLATAPGDQKPYIQKDLRILQAGIKGEQESAYFVDFALRDSKNTIVIHDLRLEVNGRVAQIDHLLLHRTLTVYVLETKHVGSGLKITEDGEFLRWNDYRKTFEGMASPLAQNERHIAVLKDAFDLLDMPSRLGIRLKPTFQSFVVLSAAARIDRPKSFDTSRIIKSDSLLQAIDKGIDNESTLATLGSLARIVSAETVEDIGRKLVKLHRPVTFGVSQRFRQQTGPEAVKADVVPKPYAVEVSRSVPVPPPSSASPTEFVCRHCGKPDLSVQYGKYGYFFKCASCDGNTPIKIDCGQAGHKERIRKEGRKFYRECAACGTSSMLFENSA